MRYTQTHIPTLREVPADAIIASHRLMFRAGLIRKLANGLFAYLPLGLRAFRKVEGIIREEMDAAGALEAKPTVVIPAELWKESGRWAAYGEALMRLRNRTGGDFVLSPTAEEAFTALLRDDLSSYRQLPLCLYQINTKYRDEIRPRYGVMRGREFIMKDAYSFHADEASLDATYRAMGAAYRRVFRRCALTVIPVQADSGAMGGSGSEEIMVESEIGDNTLLLCRACNYAANVEKASCMDEGQCLEGGGLPPRSGRASASSASPLSGGKILAHTLEKEHGFCATRKIQDENAQAFSSAPATPPPSPPMERIVTPNVKTIAELCAFLGTEAASFIKTLIYRVENAEALPNPRGGAAAPAPGAAFAAVCIRGDLDVNEVKLAALLKAAEVSLASEDDVTRLSGAPVGFAGPVGLESIPIICDNSVPTIPDAVTGALEKDLHYKHVVYGRDFSAALVADLRTVKAGDRCPLCGGELYEKKGNELGHIFKLGRKYSDSLRLSYLDEAGNAQTPLMGCYGIGLDRTLASVIEEHHDENGIIWPVSVAPYQVILVPVKYEGAAKDAADSLEAALTARGVEVLVDDREERPGVKFKDADLIGIPYRIVLGDKGLSQDPPQVELKRRAEKDARLIPLASAAEETARLVAADLAALRE
ncbi:MAG: proline--tRNA ligase [Treponema sp.]|jgi:prolyl-tRNA synthetase|nr:proline--tRNA ligase [Treponema sp.]